MKWVALTPAVSRSTRITVAGLVWTVVGVMLLSWAARWLLDLRGLQAAAAGAMGVGIGILAWRTLFARLVSVNLVRLRRSSARACLFGFIAPRGWLMTASMILLGTTLRHSNVPRPWLIATYSAIGTALLLSSLDYYNPRARNPKGNPS